VIAAAVYDRRPLKSAGPICVQVGTFIEPPAGD